MPRRSAAAGRGAENRAMAHTNAWSKIGLGAVLSCALVACGTGPGSPGATATAGDSVPPTPAQTPSSECINPPPDILTLINQTAPAACYGDAPITVVAEVTAVGAIDCARTEPVWLSCGAWVSLQPIAVGVRTTGFVLAATSGPPGLPSMFAAIHPDTAVASQDIVDRQLRITGNFDDPAAQTCRELEAPFGGPATPPDEVIGYCRNLFVMTAFESV
jgi:hypothetical protein